MTPLTRRRSRLSSNNLLARFGGALRRCRRGELATGLAVQVLLRNGSIDDHVNEGMLRPSAYDLIEVTTRGSRESNRRDLSRRGAAE